MKLFSILFLIPFLFFAPPPKVNKTLNPNKVNGIAFSKIMGVTFSSGVQNTDFALPQSASSTSETGWDDPGGAWINPENIYGAGEAAITDNAYDATDPSHVLRGYNFNFSSIPVGATIVGVTCRITARSSSATSTIALVQLLNTSGVRVGTNLASTPVATNATPANYTFGDDANLWGNALTEAWVKDADFGVGVGMINGTNNADVWIDVIELDIYYTTE